MTTTAPLAASDHAATPTTPAGPPTRTRTRWRVTMMAGLAAAAAVAVVLLAFVWPTVTSSVKDLPVVVVGTEDAANALHRTLTDDGRFDVRDAATQDEARTALTHREAYAAFVVSGSSIEVLTASAASPVVTQLVAQKVGIIGQGLQRDAITAQTGLARTAAQDGAKAAAAGAVVGTLQRVAAAQFPTPASHTGPAWEAFSAQLAGAQQQAAAAKSTATTAAAAVTAAPKPSITITDIAPLSSGDPRGTGLGLLGLPLAMGGMIGGLIVALLISGFGRRIAAAGTYALVGGLVLILIMQPWFGLLQGPFLLNWLAMGLGLFATAMTIVGLESLLGRAGIPVGAILTMFVGNPLSSLASPPEFLPGAWGAIGQWFVPGATGNLLRDLSYFPDASTAHGWLVLACWSVAGVLLAVLGRHRNEETVHLEGADQRAGSSGSRPTVEAEPVTASHGRHAAQV
ncbi:ABC transporter permease [Tersicoccus sp. MR15.9]|uniref:ABC transporter permease n=1 Tax=Tersicoccus mangrovi TaxID=3121635 RepID=UPI002FE68F51